MGNQKNIVIYMSFVFLSNLSFMTDFLSMYLLNKGISLSMVSVCFLIYQFSKFMFEIPTGFVSDRYSRKLSGMIGILLLMGANVFLFSNERMILLLSFFLKGLGVTFISGSLESLFVESIDHNCLIKYNVVERLVFYVSVAIAAGLGGTIIKYWGYGYTIVIDVFILLLTFILVCQLDERTSGGLHRDGQNVNILGVVTYILHNKIVMILLLMDFANAFAFVAVEDLYSAFWEGFGIASNWIGLIIALQLLVSSLFGFFTTKIASHFTPGKMLYLMPVLRTAVTILIYVNNMPKILIPIIYLLQLSMFTIYAPIKYQLFQKSIEPKIRSMTLSLQSLVVSFGAVLFYGFSSILGQIASISTILIIALAGATVMMTAASALLKRQHADI